MASSQPFSVRGKLILPDGVARGSVWIEGGRIVEVIRGEEPPYFPAKHVEADWVSPGFIDAQVNGSYGKTFGSDPDAVAVLSARLPATGVTAFCPTLVSLPAREYRRFFESEQPPPPAGGATPLGWHLEGPFLSTGKCGAHSAEAVTGANDDLFEYLLALPGLVLMTLAPERAGALRRVNRLRERGVQVSLGHTDSTFEAFGRAVDAGATLATHLFNAMSPFTHRAPGAVGAALFDSRVTAGLIADGVHCHPLSLQLALKTKGPEGLMLVTDAIAGAGLGPGRYPLGEQTLTVSGDCARLEDGTLAGSTLTLDGAVRNLVKLAGATPADALRMASERPARALGLQNRGSLAPGADADLTLLTQDLHVVGTYVAGELAFSAT